MRIIQTPARFHPYVGGVEKTAYHISRELVRLGHSVKVICADEPAGSGSGTVDGIEVERLSYPFKIANTNITPGLIRALRKEPCDCIHTHLPCPWSADVSALVARERKLPLFLNYDNDIVGRGVSSLVAACYNASALKVLLKTAALILLANEAYIDFSPYLKEWKKKIVVLPFGVDTERFTPGGEEESNSVFFLSRLDRFHRYKGIEYLLKAVHRVSKRVPVKLYIGGSGELLEEYRGLADSLGIGGSVVFLGGLDDSAVLEYYRKCALFVLPSVSQKQEGFGLVAVEAMACAKPVVVSDITGVAAKVRETGAGIVVKPGNDEELAAALIDVLSDATTRKEMGDRALRLVKENYTWKSYTQALMQYYSRS